MKRLITLIIACCAFTAAASGQSQDTRNEIYARYSGKEGVSSVYISPTMFNLMKEIPPIPVEDGEADISAAISSLEGMFILDIENPSVAGCLAEDVTRYISRGRYELLMEARDENDAVRMYITTDSEGDITEFVMLANESGESPSTTYICFVGKISKDSLNAIISSQQ